MVAPTHAIEQECSFLTVWGVQPEIRLHPLFVVYRCVRIMIPAVTSANGK